MTKKKKVGGVERVFRVGFVSSFQQVLHITVWTPKGKYESCFKPDFHINTRFCVQMDGGKMWLSISQALRLSQALLRSFIGIKSGHELKPLTTVALLFKCWHLSPWKTQCFYSGKMFIIRKLKMKKSISWFTGVTTGETAIEWPAGWWHPKLPTAMPGEWSKCRSVWSPRPKNLTETEIAA